MFGPFIPYHERLRIYRRRLSGAALVACLLLAAATITIRVRTTPWRPEVGRVGAPIQVMQIEEIKDRISDVTQTAGGHPLRDALAVVEFELEPDEEDAPAAVPPEPAEKTEKPSEDPLPPTEEPEPEGPADGPDPAAIDAAPQTATSADFQIVRFVKPKYPTDALLLGVEGVVRIAVHVGPDGNVTEAIPRGEHDTLPSCVEVARQAALEWRFVPYIEDGRASSFWVEIPFAFRLGKVTTGAPERS